MDTRYDRELLRKLILESMQEDAPHGYHLHELRDKVYGKYSKELYSSELRDIIFEETFKMIADGLIRPNIYTPDQGATIIPQWNTFQLTRYGRSIVERKSEHPAFVKDYLRRLISMVPEEIELDEVVDFYVKESVQLFRHDFYTSSVVMLGVASEQMVALVGEAMQATLRNQTKEKFRETMNQMSLKKRIDIISTTFASTCEDKSIIDFFEHSFRGFVTLLRKSRNEYGHPSASSATRDEALEYLYTFPEYIKRMYQVIQYFNKRMNILPNN